MPSYWSLLDRFFFFTLAVLPLVLLFFALSEPPFDFLLPPLSLLSVDLLFLVVVVLVLVLVLVLESEVVTGAAVGAGNGAVHSNQKQKEKEDEKKRLHSPVRAASSRC
jgi:hypothetical protein